MAKTVDIVQALLSQIQTIARSETVVGDPINAGDTIIVPVSHVAIGFGVGAGEMDGEFPTQSSSKGQLGASATGGGVSIDPVAFIVVTKDGRAQLLPLKGGTSQLTRVIDLVPDVLDRIMGKGGKEKKAELAETSED